MTSSNGRAPAPAIPRQLTLDNSPQARESSPRRIGPLAAARTAALWLLAALAVAASVTAFAESYHGLYVWALHHQVTRGWAREWPVQVDAFVLGPELVLLVALVDGWRTRDRLFCWLVLGAGLAASVAGNAGHVRGAVDQATNAVPPLAAAACLAFGLATLKRILHRAPVPGPGYVDPLHRRALENFAGQLAIGNVPGVRVIKRELGVGQLRAQRVRAYLRTVVNH